MDTIREIAIAVIQDEMDTTVDSRREIAIAVIRDEMDTTLEGKYRLDGYNYRF